MAIKTLVYIATTGSSVFESQVVSLLKEIKETDYFSRIILLAGIKPNQDWSKELEGLLKSNLEVILFKQYPNYGIFRYSQKRELSFIFKRILSETTVVHLRGESFSGIVNEIRKELGNENTSILSDIRGLASDEVELYLKRVYNPIKYYFKISHFKKTLKNAADSSDLISCISESLKKVIIDRTFIDTNRIVVNNCIAGREFTFHKEKRAIIRSMIGIHDDEILCVFVTGGYSLYEDTKKIVSTLVGRGLKFLNLSKSNIDKAINLYVPYSEVPYYLSAADIGIIWRENNIVNNVSSPVKFSEYLCCGLPVISNNCIHLVSDYLTETGHGKIINSPDDITIDLCKELLRIDRNLISKNAKDKFSSSVIVSNYIETYKRLLGN